MFTSGDHERLDLFSGDMKSPLSTNFYFNCGAPCLDQACTEHHQKPQFHVISYEFNSTDKCDQGPCVG